MREHDEWLSILEKAFNERGYITIREGKMFMKGGRWKIPDLFVLQAGQLVLLLEVIVTEDYPRILTKAKRIKEQYNPKHIIVFEPVKYLDENFLPTRKEYYKNKHLGHYPSSYEEIEKYFVKKWWEEENLKVIFWNETNYRKNIEELSK